jgi:hypothetical protein
MGLLEQIPEQVVQVIHLLLVHPKVTMAEQVEQALLVMRQVAVVGREQLVLRGLHLLEVMEEPEQLLL